MVKAGKRVAIYCRVSTKDKGQTTENQRLALGGRVATEYKVGFSHVLARPEVTQLRPEELTQSLLRKSRQQCASNGWSCL
jgi:hypothetical protein